MRTILFLTPRYPWPLIGGDRIKCYFLLRHLAKHNRLILVTFSHRSSSAPEYLEAIQSLGIELHTVKLNPVLAAVGCLRTLWTQQPIEIAFYNRPAFARAVQKVVGENTIDTSIAFFMRTAEYIRAYTHMHKVLIAEDSRIEYQTRSMNASTSWLQRFVRWWEIQKLRTYEPAVMRDFDDVTFVTYEDIEAMEAVMPSSKYSIVTNGVDLERFSYEADQTHRSGILFIGKLNVHANELMVESICDEIFPLVRAQLPDAKLTIVGEPRPKNLSKSWSAVNFTGHVPNHVPYLHDAAIFLHPHSGGSGIQNKLLEAMAAGCAVVTTTSGLQGIEAVHGRHCLVFSTAQEAAAHVVRLLQNPQERASLAANARTLIENTHSWDLVDQQMDEVLTPRRTGLLLDRDGIINERIVDGYVRSPADFRLLPEIIPVIQHARDLGIPVIVITNQQGVGKGLMSDSDLERVHQHMNTLLIEHTGSPADAIYACTTLKSANDPRRKPNPGMIYEAIRDFHLDPSTTWFIGDSESDAVAGKRAGVRTMLVGPFPPHTADVVVSDLRASLAVLKEDVMHD